MTHIWVALGLLFIGHTDAQFGFNPYYEDVNPLNPSAYQPSTSFNDPIRRALGIWGRLLNRMSQPNLPTDEELRFHLQPEEESDRQTSRFISPVRGAGIIDERKLNELLPRFREPPTTPESISTTTATTTTTSTTTTSTAKPTTTTTAVMKKQNPKKSSKKTTTPRPRSTSTSSSSSESEESTTTPKPSTTSTLKSHGMEPIFDDVSRIRVRVTSIDQYRNSTTAAATTTTSSALEKRTDSPKETTTVEDEDKEHKEGMEDAIQSALADDALIVSTTEAGDTDAPNNVDDAETVEGSGAIDDTTASVTEESTSSVADDNASSEAANQDETSQELNAPESGAAESNEPQDLQWEDESDEPKTTLPPPITTTRKPATTTPKPTKPTQSSIRRSPFPSKKAPAGRRGSLPDIPEAEEEEQSDVEATTQQVNPTSTIGGIAGRDPQTVYNLNANANSNSSPNVASVITPVNSIIDGIGPLILPLLGYTNRAVAPYVGRRVAGVRNYQPSSYQPVQLRTLADGVYQPANGYPSDYESNSILNMAQLATQAVLGGAQNPQTYRSSLLAQQQLRQALGPQAPVVNRQAIASLPTGTGRMTGGPRSRFVPDPAMGPGNAQASAFVTPGSPTVPEAMLRQEHSGRIRGTDTPYYGPQINYYLGDEVNSNRLQQVPRPTQSPPPAPKETGPDPGYNEGRSNVAGAFFEDSGVMVNSSPPTPPQEPDFESFRQTTAGGGFGGGRKPVASYEDVAKMPSYA